MIVRRVRMVVLPAKVPEEIRTALGREASGRGLTRSKLVLEILKAHLNGHRYTQKPDQQIERSERREP